MIYPPGGEPPETVPGELLEVPNRSPGAAPVPKVIAATAGAGLGASIGIILPWLFKTYLGTDMPVEVAVAFGGLFSTGLAGLLGYLTPPRSL